MSDQKISAMEEKNSNLVQLIYISRQLNTLRADQTLSKILSTARKNNSLYGITGILITTNDSFIQLLEGSVTHVNDLYRNLILDPRHRKVHLLRYKPIVQRSYQTWSMGHLENNDYYEALISQYTRGFDRGDVNILAEATSFFLKNMESKQVC